MSNKDVQIKGLKEKQLKRTIIIQQIKESEKNIVFIGFINQDFFVLSMCCYLIRTFYAGSNSS